MCDVDLVLEEIRKTRGSLTPEEEAEIREDVRCQVEHGGEHVAYIDRWTEEDGRRCLRRELLAHSESTASFLKDQRQALEHLKPEERCLVRTRFFMKPVAKT